MYSETKVTVWISVSPVLLDVPETASFEGQAPSRKYLATGVPWVS